MRSPCRTAKLLTAGRSQAVRLPVGFRFEGREVFIRRDPRVRQFLLRVDVLAWDRDVTQVYADLRASCELKGVTLAPLDMMIAAQAVAADAVLVTTDKAFSRVPHPLQTVNWDGTR